MKYAFHLSYIQFVTTNITTSDTNMLVYTFKFIVLRVRPCAILIFSVKSGEAILLSKIIVLWNNRTLETSK